MGDYFASMRCSIDIVLCPNRTTLKKPHLTQPWLTWKADAQAWPKGQWQATSFLSFSWPSSFNSFVYLRKQGVVSKILRFSYCPSFPKGGLPLTEFLFHPMESGNVTGELAGVHEHWNHLTEMRTFHLTLWACLVTSFFALACMYIYTCVSLLRLPQSTGSLFTISESLHASHETGWCAIHLFP